MNKIYNFSPGPSKINEGVIKEVQKSIENYKDTGKSVLEISHRSKDFDEILAKKRFYKKVIFPSDGIGTGIAQLPTKAPNTWRYLQKKFAEQEFEK